MIANRDCWTCHGAGIVTDVVARHGGTYDGERTVTYACPDCAYRAQYAPGPTPEAREAIPAMRAIMEAAPHMAPASAEVRTVARSLAEHVHTAGVLWAYGRANAALRHADEARDALATLCRLMGYHAPERRP